MTRRASIGVYASLKRSVSARQISRLAFALVPDTKRTCRRLYYVQCLPLSAGRFVVAVMNEGELSQVGNWVGVYQWQHEVVWKQMGNKGVRIVD